MPGITPFVTIKEHQKFTKEVYGVPNERHFSI